MRYIATVANSQYLRDYTDKPCEQACVTAPFIESSSLALRHARAMAAVLRAAKAEHRLLMQLNRQYETPGPGGDVFTALHKRWALARQKSVDATARLVAVENEVGDGQ